MFWGAIPSFAPPPPPPPNPFLALAYVRRIAGMACEGDEGGQGGGGGGEEVGDDFEVDLGVIPSADDWLPYRVYGLGFRV
jgi:hypothetical protein